MTTHDLLGFLRARLDEDEQVARAVEDRSAPWNGQWVAEGQHALRTVNGHVLAYSTATTDGRNLPIPLKPGLTEHWARHDPARVLAEAAAKRRMLDELFTDLAAQDRAIWSDYDVDPDMAGTLLRYLALSYAGHPDYRPEWAPGRCESDRATPGGFGRRARARSGTLAACPPRHP